MGCCNSVCILPGDQQGYSLLWYVTKADAICAGSISSYSFTGPIDGYCNGVLRGLLVSRDPRRQLPPPSRKNPTVTKLDFQIHAIRDQEIVSSSTVSSTIAPV